MVRCLATPRAAKNPGLRLTAQTPACSGTDHFSALGVKLLKPRRRVELAARADMLGRTMSDQTIARINLLSFTTALVTIALGVIVGILGVWGVPRTGGLLWRALATDRIVFAGCVLTNLAIACYRKPGGALE